MPVLNREDTIEKAILSVLNQDYQNFELIILDGGSKDKTLEIIKQYERKITYWHSQKDNSAAVATNMGISKATGDYIGLLMADDWYEPHLFQKIAEAHLRNRDADMITCGGQIVRHNEHLNRYQSILTYNDPKTLALNFYNILFAVSAICCRFVSKSFYHRLGFYLTFDAEGKHLLTNDKEFLLRAVLHHPRHIFIDYIGHTYLAHKESYSFGNNRKSSKRHCEEHMFIAEMYLQKKNVHLSQKILLHYCYNIESIKLFFHYLLDANFTVAARLAKEGMYKYAIFWPIMFCITPMLIFVKRCLRKLRC